MVTVMGTCEDKSICKSIFKNSHENITSEVFTKAFAKMINNVESSKTNK